MKYLIFLLLILIPFYGCASINNSKNKDALCPSPSKDIFFFAISPDTDAFIPIIIKKGEFDLSEEERQYTLFNTIEELFIAIKTEYLKRDQKGI